MFPESISNETNSLLQIEPSRMVVVDLRDAADFEKSHIPGSISLDVDAKALPNPYQDPSTLVNLFKLLDKRLAAADPVLGALLDGKVVFTLSYKGHVARLAMAILRNRKVQAHCVVGGFDAWMKSGLWEESCGLAFA